jgi:spore germination cell wall hydrolase CwlJ-like protein
LHIQEGELGERKMITAKLLLAYFLSTANLVGLDVDTSKVDPEQAYCLAENIYYEARNEDIQGQFAVASVTLNRANDARFPRTVCEVVKQTAVSRISKKLVCAFSWYCENDKKGREIPVKNKDGTVNQQVVDQFQVASIVAITVLGGSVNDNTNGATHFHNPYISQPAWRLEMKRTIRMGNHDFYRMPPPKGN